jgi:hypothetical protein
LKDAGKTTTLAHCLKLLDRAGMVGGLEKYSLSAILQRASSPKLQVFNTALMSAMSSVQRQDIIGRRRSMGIGLKVP